MHIKAGSILISAPSLEDPNFEKVVVFIAEYNEKGAMGFVVNKLFPRHFNELVEYRNSLPFPLYEGGPVENEHLYFLHQRPDMIDGGTKIVDAVYLGGDFKQAVTAIDQKNIQVNDIRLFIGYCGWDPFQLEAEIDEGSWLISNSGFQIVFSEHNNMIWEYLYSSLQ